MKISNWLMFTKKPFIFRSNRVYRTGYIEVQKDGLKIIKGYPEYNDYKEYLKIEMSKDEMLLLMNQLLDELGGLK